VAVSTAASISSGAAIGIGIGVGVGGLCCIVVGCYALRRSTRKRALTTQPTAAADDAGA
jgi:hypothetical protein